MNYKKTRTALAIVIGLSAVGWVLFGLFFLPEGFVGPEPPIALSAEPFGFCPFFLLIVALLVPIVSGVGWVMTTMLSIREDKRGQQEQDWEKEANHETGH
jgi:hypothetical protein